MSFRAILYTAAAIAFFVLMVMRPAVDISTVTGTSPVTEQQTTDQPTTDQPATDQPATNPPATDQPVTDQPTTEQPTTDQPATDTEQTGGQDTEKPNSSSGTAETDTAQTAGSEPDYARERRIRNQISDAILEGEVQFLHDGARNFMAIQTVADNARGGAVILHGRGFHPDWEDTVYPLRTGLVEEGWTTLSLQMPVLEKQAKYYDYVPLFPEANKRITAGIQHLKDQGISPIVLIAHSCGGHMAMQWVRDNGDSDIAAFAGLGLGATDTNQFMDKPFPLDKMQVPILDVYGENDFPAVIKMAPERWKLTTAAGNPQSEQRVLSAADHYYKGQGDELVGLVATWLNNLRF